jgi:hypothetical protein
MFFGPEGKKKKKKKHKKETFCTLIFSRKNKNKTQMLSICMHVSYFFLGGSVKGGGLVGGHLKPEMMDTGG